MEKASGSTIWRTCPSDVRGNLDRLFLEIIPDRPRRLENRLTTESRAAAFLARRGEPGVRSYAIREKRVGCRGRNYRNCICTGLMPLLRLLPCWYGLLILPVAQRRYYRRRAL